MKLRKPESVSVRQDGAYVCWHCDAVLATKDEHMVVLINGYYYAGITAIAGSRARSYWEVHKFPLGRTDPFPTLEYAIPVFRAGKQAKADYLRDCWLAERGDQGARERLRTGQSTKHVRYAVMDQQCRSEEECQHVRVLLYRQAEASEDPLEQQQLLALASAPDEDLYLPTARHRWIEPEGDAGRLRIKMGQAAVVECLRCGARNGFEVI